MSPYFVPLCSCFVVLLFLSLSHEYKANPFPLLFWRHNNNRTCGVMTDTNRYCSLTGIEHPDLDATLLKYKRTYILPGRVSELFAGAERPALAKIMQANIAHLEVSVFCMMVITQMTSPKLAVEANKKELLDSGVLPVLVEAMRKYETLCPLMRG